MVKERCEEILDIGRSAALSKMTLPRCIEKQDMCNFTLADLLVFLEEEVYECRCEVVDSLKHGLSQSVIARIRDEAADIIAFASGITAKCKQLYEAPPES